MTELELKFLQDLMSCPFPKNGHPYNLTYYSKKDTYDHFVKLGWKEKSFKGVLGSLYKKNILHPEVEMFFVV